MSGPALSSRTSVVSVDLKAFLCPSQQRGCGSRLNIIIAAEGAVNRAGKAISCEDVKQVCNDKTPAHRHIREAPVVLY